MVFKSLFGTSLKKGNPAPEFAGVDQSGKNLRLADYVGQWFVLYFYPKDDTAGCTREACSFRDQKESFDQLKVPVIGVSVDDADSHHKFAEKYRLNFSLLADADRKICKAYGVLSPLDIANRVTFLIDPQGRIADIIEWANWSTYSKTVLARLHAQGVPA